MIFKQTETHNIQKLICDPAWSTEAGIFVAIAKNTLYQKMYAFMLQDHM